MDRIILLLGWIALAGLATGVLLFFFTSLRERKFRAVRITAIGLIPLIFVCTAMLFFDYHYRTSLVALALIFALSGGIIITYPLGTGNRIRFAGQQYPIDERQAIFHRFTRLEPGSPEYDEYYRDHPELIDFDNRVRKLPQLCSPGSRSYSQKNSPFAPAAFDILEQLAADLEWEPLPFEVEPIETTPKTIADRLKGFAKYLGADDFGTTELNPAYIYSHIGRSPGQWGEPITLNHTHAIAIAVEMNHDMVAHGPDLPTVTETAVKYFEAAKIATILARYINRLGYEARAHIDGNYRVLCGPIAADAGLGELGRLGLLISPKFGPRMRLAIVTTNLVLPQGKPISFGVQHFCEFCKKCAICCPSAAIDAGSKEIHNGVEKWQSNQESCYKYWRTQGTDCAVCVRVCPFGHPGTFLHNLVRWAISRNSIARRLALIGDDIFYGKRPEPADQPPPWHARGG